MFKFIKKTNLLLYLFVLIFTLHALQIVFFKQAELFKSYDTVYWKDRFEHSQWVMPLSRRLIGDDGLYSYVGYKIFIGDSIDKYNPETPPLVKYLFGASIYLFHNPLLVSVLFGLGTLIFLFLIASKLLKSKKAAFYFVTFIFVDKLFFSQFYLSLLDLPQLFFMAASVYYMILLLEIKNAVWALLSGILLGLFAVTKVPLFSPIIFLLEIAVLSKKSSSKKIPVYLAGILFGFLLPYIPYLIQGHSSIDLIRLQKYILNFYTSSKLQAKELDVLSTLFFGKFNSFGLNSVAEWTILWPLAFISSLVVIARHINNNYVKFFGIFLISAMVMIMRVPFYPRYLLLVLPIIYLMSIFLIEKLQAAVRNVLYSVCLIYAFYQAFLFINPSPNFLLQDFYYNFSHFYFQDIYKEDIFYKPNIKFVYFANSAISQANIKSIKIDETERNFPAFGNKGYVKIQIEYFTQDLGIFRETKKIELSKIRQEWKINWDWSTIMNGYSPGDNFETTIVTGIRGSILDENGNRLAYDGNGYILSVNPSKIESKKESDMLAFISTFSLRQPIQIQNAYLENPTTQNVYLTTFFRELSPEDLAKINSYKGITLKPHNARLYNSINPKSSIKNTLYEECCTSIYSSYSYHGIGGLEARYDNTLSGSDGGSLVLKNKDGLVKRIIIDKNAQDGKDVRINSL